LNFSVESVKGLFGLFHLFGRADEPSVSALSVRPEYNFTPQIGSWWEAIGLDARESSSVELSWLLCISSGFEKQSPILLFPGIASEILSGQRCSCLVRG
jgi:hypothetical protein